MLKTTSTILKSLGLTRPAVVVDEIRARANIRAMAEKAAAGGVRFRPHYKTHQSGAVGEWFRDAGVESITVSSVAMAQYFAEFGWKDITVAFLFNPLEGAPIRELAAYLNGRGGRLGLTVDSVAAVEALGALDIPLDIWIKVDTGYGRTGVRWDQAEAVRAVSGTAADHLRLNGLLTHTGHSYDLRSGIGLTELYRQTVTRMESARDSLSGSELEISIGDTPLCCGVPAFDGVDEIRPGNFVFGDLMQLEIGSMNVNDLAAAVACPVVGIYPERREAVVHGGAVHLAKERLEGPVFGKLGIITEEPRAFGPLVSGAVVTSLSQEHGVIRFEDQVPDDLVIGDLVLIHPVHSCLTCDLHREYRLLDGSRIDRL